jgi:hypothetical protein
MASMTDFQSVRKSSNLFTRTTMNGPIRFKVRLLRDIKSITKTFPRGTIQHVTKLSGGRLQIEGYSATTLADKDWELYWDEYAIRKILDEKK